ncbi:hypothetical protein AB0D11_45310 [Streptomyces monashensis]
MTKTAGGKRRPGAYVSGETRTGGKTAEEVRQQSTCRRMNS